MCLYPKLIINKKYTNTKKNGGNIPPIKDMRTLYIPVACGNCIECRKQKSREWQVRLLEDIKENKHGVFITLTFSNESILELCEKYRNLKGYTLDNAIATLGVRRYLERHRKKHGKSIRHWLVTELGHEGTENIHLHGIIWPDSKEMLKDLEETWQYGFVWKGKPKKVRGITIEYINYVNERTIGYITKYVSKQDVKHKHYKPIILTSKGIGRNYIDKLNARNNRFNGNNTDTTYRTNSGHKIGLPTYWRNKIYTDEEKEQLWINSLDKGIRWIRGEKINTKNGHAEYWKTLAWHQRENIELGYGSRDIDYDKKELEEQYRIIQQETRIKAALKSKKIRKERERLNKIIKEI